jgi:hypothetical protein
LAAARRANMRQGERTDLTAIAVTSQADAAAQFDVRVDTLQRAKTGIKHADPALVEAVESATWLCHWLPRRCVNRPLVGQEISRPLQSRRKLWRPMQGRGDEYSARAES